MSFITYLNRNGQCPSWQIDVCISGKYVINEETDTGSFISAECPIVQQLKLPMHKRDLKCREIPFCNKEGQCQLLKSFPANINRRDFPWI